MQDTGVGMPPEVRDRVFEPFFTTKEVGKGSGLGLSQVYGFVRQSDGEVRLDSDPGAGSTFRLRLPLTDQEAQPLRPDEPAAEIVGGHENVLLVEDDPTVLSLTLDLLSGLGYQVNSATNAAEALEILKSPAPACPAGYAASPRPPTSRKACRAGRTRPPRSRRARRRSPS